MKKYRLQFNSGHIGQMEFGTKDEALKAADKHYREDGEHKTIYVIKIDPVAVVGDHNTPIQQGRRNLV